MLTLSYYHNLTKQIGLGEGNLSQPLMVSNETKKQNMANKVRIEDIAKECGVTKGLVSRALAGKYNVSDTTRNKIIQKAVEMGYDLKKLKAYRKTAERILLVCSSRLFFREDFWQPIIKSISTALNHSNIILEYFIFDEESMDETTFSQLRKNIYGGYIVIHLNPKILLDVLTSTKKPVVVVDPKQVDVNAVQVKFSNFDSIYFAGEYLINKGHKDIAFYGSDDHSMSFFERHQGFITCINDYKEKGINFYEAIFSNKNKMYCDDALLINLLNNNKVTAIVCANDIIAINACRVIKKLKMRVPDDISIIGFDNVKIGEDNCPPITTFNVPREQLGVEIARYLSNSLSNNQAQYSQIVIRCEFIERESVKSIE